MINDFLHIYLYSMCTVLLCAQACQYSHPSILKGFVFPLHFSHAMNFCATGGLGEAVCSAIVNESGFNLHRLAVSHVPRSGKPHELLKIYGIDRDAIAQSVRKMLSSSTNAK